MRKFFKYFLLGTSVLFGLLLALCRTIPNLNPYEQSFTGILGLAAPLLALVNVLFLLVWLVLRKFAFVCIPLAALLISWKIYAVTIALNLFNKQDFDASDRSFTVMSYNVRLLDLYKWSGKKDTREKIIRFLSEQHASVLCLQEFYNGNDSIGKNNLKDIAEQCGYAYYATCDINVNKRGSWGSVIFSHLPIIAKQNHDIDVFGSNLLQQVDILFQHDTISIFNIHLKSNRFSNEEADMIVKNEEIKLDEKTGQKTKNIYEKLEKNASNRGLEAALVAKIIRSNKHKTIVCGDLNDIPSSYVYFKMRDKLRDAYLENGCGIGSTFITKIPVLRIDYIFHSADLEAIGFKKMEKEFSDHYPLLANFRL